MKKFAIIRYEGIWYKENGKTITDCTVLDATLIDESDDDKAMYLKARELDKTMSRTEDGKWYYYHNKRRVDAKRTLAEYNKRNGRG